MLILRVDHILSGDQQWSVDQKDVMVRTITLMLLLPHRGVQIIDISHFLSLIDIFK